MGNKVNNCKFCQIISENDKNVILYEDEHLVIFNDIKPSAKHHLLVVPKTHITNANRLNKEHIILLNYMKENAIEFLTKEGLIFSKEDEYYLGFHIPPFVMIHHLHLHVLVPPFKSKFGKHVMFGYMFRSLDTQIKQLDK